MENEKRLIDIYADTIADFIPRLSKCMDLDSAYARTTIKNVLTQKTRDVSKTHVLVGINRMKLRDTDHTFDELFTPISKLEEMKRMQEHVSDLVPTPPPNS